MRITHTKKGIIHFFATALFAFLLFCAPAIPSQIAHGTIAIAEAAPPEPAAPQATVKTAEGAKADTKATGDNSSAIGTIGRYLGYMILNVASTITWMGGKLLEVSMDELIFKMGAYVNGGAPLGIMIEKLWTLIRDISNLLFIFGFIYIGIRTIIDSESSSTKRMLAQIIIAALLINFSLFFTRVIIDFSNLLAVEVKTAMMQGTGSISEHFAKLLGLSGIWGSPSSGTIEALAKNTAMGNIWFFFMGSIFLLVAGFVLAAGGILIVVRFVALVFIMIFSPILFAATVFPQTGKYASMLWSKLISYSFFAPAYLLLLLISMHVLAAVTNQLNKNNAYTMLDSMQRSNQAGFDSFAVILNFTVAIMFLIFSLQIAQKFGVLGADKAISIGKDLRGRGQRMLGNAAGGATFGAAAVIGREVAGRYGNKLANDSTLKDKAATSWVAKQKLKLAKTAADSSFDARKVGGLGNELGIGEGRKGGYKTIKEEAEKKEKEFAEKYLGEVGDDDVRVQARKKEWEAAQKTQKAETESLRKRLRELDKDDVAGRADLQGKIDKLEKDTKDAQIKYEKEKQRRIIGSTYAEPETASDKAALQSIKDEITAKKAAVKREWDGDDNGYLSYKGLSEAEQATRRDEIAKLNKELSDLEKKEYEHLTQTVKDRGYAGIAENAGRFKFLPKMLTDANRFLFTKQRNEAGKAVRKSAEKGLPKKKDD